MKESIHIKIMNKKFRMLIIASFLICSIKSVLATETLYLGTGFQHFANSIFIFYPSNEKNTATKIGKIEIDANESVGIADKKFPLIILSHGTGAGALAHHNLIKQLTKYGFIVVSLTHSDDNFSNWFYHVENIYTRVNEISHLIDQLPKSSLSKHIDFNKINFIGYSAGGHTGLFLSGAKFNLDNYNSYLNRHPNCPMQAGQKNMPKHLTSINQITADPRIKKFVLMAPPGFLFSNQSLAQIKSPIMVIGGEKDELLDPQENFIDLTKKLTSSQHKLLLIPDAGHFVFLAPCNKEQLENNANTFCIGSAQRTKLMPKIAQEINDFLKEHL